MKRKWTSILTLGVVAALIAGPAWAQTTPSTPSDADKSAPAMKVDLPCQSIGSRRKGSMAATRGSAAMACQVSVRIRLRVSALCEPLLVI